MPELDHIFALRAMRAKTRGPAFGPEPFTGVCTDSRAVEPGQLFVALEGPNFDGHDYVAAAFEKGAAAAVVREGFAAGPDDRLLEVRDTLAALGDLAGAWRKACGVLVAAVTGSNGKTTTKEMLAAILSQKHEVHKNRGNFNNLIGLPLTLLAIKPEHTAVVVEMGMNRAGEIRRLAKIAAPDAGLVNNVGPAHIGLLGSMEAVAAAKAELFEELPADTVALVNLDDPLLAPWAEKLSCRVVSFGFAKDAQVRGADISAMGSRQAFSLYLPGQDPIRPRLAAPGEHNVMNALGAAAAAWALGLTGPEIKAGLEEFAPVPGRLSVVKGATGPWILDDTYNANLASVKAGLQALIVIAAGRPMGLILGDMKELGSHSDEMHRQAGEAAAKAGCRAVLALGEKAPLVVEAARKAGVDPALALAFSNRDELIKAAVEIFNDKDVVLIKGSRSMAMEKVVAGVKGPEGDWY